MPQPNYVTMINNESILGEFVAMGAVDYYLDGDKSGVYNYPIKLSNSTHLATQHCLVNSRENHSYGIRVSGKKTTCRTNIMIRDPNTGRFMSWKKLVAAGYTQFDLSDVPAFPTAQ